MPSFIPRCSLPFELRGAAVYLLGDDSSGGVWISQRVVPKGNGSGVRFRKECMQLVYALTYRAWTKCSATHEPWVCGVPSGGRRAVSSSPTLWGLDACMGVYYACRADAAGVVSCRCGGRPRLEGRRGDRWITNEKKEKEKRRQANKLCAWTSL